MEAKIQKHKVGGAGSFFNQLMSNNATVPVVGEGATQMHYTDRSCFDVIEVSEDGTEVRLQYLQAEWDQSLPGGEGHQNWKLVPIDQFVTVVWRKHKQANGQMASWMTRGREIVFTKECKAMCEKEGYDYIGQWLQKTRPEIAAQVYEGRPYPQNVVEGYTRAKTVYSKIRIIFGVKDYYHDWSF